MLAEYRRAPASNATSRTSIRTTDSRSWLNFLVCAARAGETSKITRKNDVASAEIDRGRKGFTVAGFNDGYQVYRLQLPRDRASLAIILGGKSLVSRRAQVVRGKIL